MTTDHVMKHSDNCSLSQTLSINKIYKIFGIDILLSSYYYVLATLYLLV